jgi:hypothetical protein
MACLLLGRSRHPARNQPFLGAYHGTPVVGPLSDFAIDVRKVVEMDSLPEYTSILHKNEEGEEVIHFLKRDLLSTNDPRYEPPRHRPSSRRGHFAPALPRRVFVGRIPRSEYNLN